MRPMLDDLALPQVQAVTTTDVRAIAEHKPPGMAGSLLQNLGRRPSDIVVCGVATGTGVRDFVEALEAKARAGTAVPFTADITADSQIQQVIIADVAVEDVAGRPDRIAYRLTLREWIEPERSSAGNALGGDIGADAAALVGGLADGLDIAGEFATGLERFLPQLGDLLTRLRDAKQRIEASGGG